MKETTNLFTFFEQHTHSKDKFNAKVEYDRIKESFRCGLLTCRMPERLEEFPGPMDQYEFAICLCDKATRSKILTVDHQILFNEIIEEARVKLIKMFRPDPTVLMVRELCEPKF